VSDDPVLNASDFSSFWIEVKNHVEPFWDAHALTPTDMPVAFEATFEIADRDAYERLLGVSSIYTVEIETDHNPWHRPAGWRARVWWTVQKRVLRRPLVERTKIVIPNCEIKETPS
jgi:hypothetical protein